MRFLYYCIFVLELPGEEKSKTPLGQLSHKNRPGNSRTRNRLEKSVGEKLCEHMKSWIVDLGKAEIGLGIAIFGISVKNYRGYRNSRPNPLLGNPFCGRLQISIPIMAFSGRKPCPVFQSEPLCENCPACKNSKPPLGNFRTKNETAILKKKYSTQNVFVFFLLPIMKLPQRDPN